MTSSIYSITRNPLYVGAFMAYTGIGLACRSWIFLLCAAIWIVSWHLAVPAEERILISKYGSAYEEYMEATPRWIGWPRSGKVNRDSP
jgi:protein-S-isoprenylcysteine O-methyltransferase Ste14